ncbi:DUF397 domain-containing protein [Kitasatospora purpeofusca]|uniref:DUF397 domain-containing protein n=1 Tax=Kitasatospora purpeofusca TaxID=67352 RepID=UPI002257ED13|nr:DUF397 domain-containing protein [Kitasatospora purpeofusca]MCX4754344.1 DUF397 domain-containing protein [Kitasatospora purpeofusca]WSR33772.1 DUF397 domain-containing protein [Kitasatospora purpeofusca]
MASSWQKSSYSGANNDCIEIRNTDGLVALRESDESDSILATTPAAFANLLGIIKAGGLDHHV